MVGGYSSDTSHPWGVGRWHWNSRESQGWDGELTVIHAGLVGEAMGVNQICEEEVGSLGTPGFEGRMEEEETGNKRKAGSLLDSPETTMGTDVLSERVVDWVCV